MKKTTASVKDSVYKELINAINRFKLTQYFEFNRTEFRATCKINGTEFRCIGLDVAEKIKGYADISDVYLDEATAFTPDDFYLIDGTLRSKAYKLPLQIYVSFNPIAKTNWVYKYFGFDTGIVPDNTFILKTTYLDNPKADIINYMDALKKRNPQRYKIEALGDFASLDQQVYTNWRVEEFDYRDIKGELMCGLDFGFTNDPTAFTASLLVENEKKIYIFKEWGGTGKTNKDIADAITALGFAKSTIIADSAEPKSVEELRRNGLYRVRASVKGPDSILHGIQKIQQYELIIHPSCQEVITELENYTWQKDKATGEYINKPIDLFNHFLDGFRYSLQSVGDGKLKTINKSILGL